MGKGDKKSKKGKIWRDSYGKKRNKKSIKERLKRIASVKKTAVGANTEKPKVRKTVRKKESAS
ncbi:MAG: 30S ribosomal protein THX [Cyclobacteriaceae bacterium]